MSAVATEVVHHTTSRSNSDAGSIPAASTNLHHNASFRRMRDLLGKSDV